MLHQHVAFEQALQAALALAVSHSVCVAIIMYLDLSGRWQQYSLHKQRSASVSDYAKGMKSFAADIVLLFVPFMTLCFWYRAEAIAESKDSPFRSVLKLVGGYLLGKVWAFVVHYALHFPSLYQFHRRHHCNPRTIVAAAAWQDSYVEYCVMELPSFAMTVLLFPTHFYVHLWHFVFHGLDGAAGHSGFKAPGILGYLFDGEYHYYHHAFLTVNYAEVEIIDRMFGTHHSQKKQRPK